MVVYLVKWFYVSELGKGKGKITNKEGDIIFTVLCRNSKDALKCLDYYFFHIYNKVNKHGITLDDGEVYLKRVSVDSRNIIIHYLLADSMTEPLDLSDLDTSIFRLTHRYSV